MTTSSDRPEDRLEAERTRLRALLADLDAQGERPSSGDTTSDGELSSADQHPADEGTETQYREQRLAEREQLAAELTEVDAAAGRVRDGTYGRCQACGRPIGDERLAALPAARFCLDDERLAEAEAAHPQP